MGTSAEITFKASEAEFKKMKALIEPLDEITNNSGLGVACTPHCGKNRGEDTYYFGAQTHWSYDGSNGREFLRELKKMIAEREIKIEIIDEWEA